MSQQRDKTPGYDLAAGVVRHQLANGLKIITREVHSKPIVSAMIWYRVGSRNEQPGRTGQSHFLEHMLFQGTDRFAKGEIDSITLAGGGSNNAFTDTDFTAYFFNFASDRWQVALDIEASRMINNTFDHTEFALEKEVVIEELRIAMDNPPEALDQAVWAASYWQHPYRHPVIGWLDDLERAMPDEMESYYKAWYHPRNATLVIVGDFDEARAVHRVEELFDGFDSGPEPSPMPLREAPQRGERRVVIKRPAEIERLQFAFHVPEVAHADAPALQVIATLLGTGKTSRLYQRLIEIDQSVISQSVEYNERVDPGLLLVRADIKPGRRIEEVERASFEELDRLKQQTVSEGELARAKRLIRSQFVFGNEQVSSQAITLGFYETIYRYEYLSECQSLIESVTADDVQAAARQYLGADNRTVGHLIRQGVGSA